MISNVISSGLGIRPEFFNEVLRQKPSVDFFEAHSENYFGESIARVKLLELREDYPISLHGVGLSLGRADDLDMAHLQQLKQLINEVDPMFVSEHLAWSAYSHIHVPDLLPLPLNEQSLHIMCEHVEQTQEVLQRQILIENPSNYLLFDQLQIPEPEFLNELASRTGCQLLVDVNNIYVSAKNLGRDPHQYLTQLSSQAIEQYHLAGYTEVSRGGETLLIDTHNQTVYPAVWSLFEQAISLHGVHPVLVEWDSDSPPLEALLAEVNKATLLINSYREKKNALVLPEVQMQVEGIVTLAKNQEAFLQSLLSLNSELTGATQAHQSRVWVYQNNVYAAVIDYLSEVYPATKGVVGDVFFKQMVREHIENDPPSKGDIHQYGDSFVNVINGFNVLTDLPYLRDLIIYEWALHCAYAAIISDSLEPSKLEQLELLTLNVGFNHSVCLLESSFPIHEIHRQSLPEYTAQVSVDLTQGGDMLLVYKEQHVVQCKVLNEDENLFFQQIRQNANLLTTIEACAGLVPEEVMSNLLSFVFSAKLLVMKI